MKKLLTVLVLLLPLLTSGQRIANPRVTVRSCATCTDVLYYATVTVPAGTYPATVAGRVAFQRDILAGKFKLVLDNGASIAIGTQPPRVPPTGAITTPGTGTVATGPTWAGARSSYPNDTMYVEGTGEIARLKFELADGSSFTGKNKDGVNLLSGSFYGYGSNPNQGIYDKQWKARFSPSLVNKPVKLTFERTTGETYGYTFTPAAGADRTVLFQTATSTTAPTPTAPVSFTRVLVVGNSITLSGPFPDPNNWKATRGMAATADNLDFVHVLQDKLRQLVPGAIVVAKNQGSALERVYANNNDDVTNTITNLTFELNRDYPGVQFDAVIVAISENIDNSNFDPDKFRTMLGRLLADIPKKAGCKIVFRNSVWAGKESSNAFLQNEAVVRGAAFADMSPIRENALYMNTGDWNDAGVKHHPNDAGMARKADILYAALGAGTTASAPTTGAVPTLSGGWAEGTLSQLFALAPFVPTNNQVGSWAPNTEQILSNSLVTIGIRNSVGGSLTRTVDARWGFNMINTNALGQDGQYGKEDTGRSEDFSAYGHPDGGDEANGHPYTQDGKTTAITVSGDDTGFNPVPGGSRFLDRPGVDWFEKRSVNGTDVLYVRTTPFHWSLHSGRSQSRRHAWFWLEGRVQKWVYLYENFRSDTQGINELRQQEGPFSYAIGDLYRQYVSFDQGGITPTEITSPPPGPPSNQTDTGNKLTAGSWIGAYDNQGRGYALIAPYCSLMGGKQFIGQGGNEYSNSSGYICVRTTLDFDTPTNFMVAGSKHIGTLQELQDYLRANPVSHRPFKYNFAGGLFQGWFSINGYLRRVGSEAVFGIGSGKGHNPSERGAAKLFSPFGHYVAAQTPVLYLNMAVTGNAQLFIGFQKTGQAEGDVFPNGQYKVINVTGDGQYRTYAVDLSGTPGYSGIVGQYFIQNPIGYSPGGSETIKLGWFNTQNSRP